MFTLKDGESTRSNRLTRVIRLLNPGDQVNRPMPPPAGEHIKATGEPLITGAIQEGNQRSQYNQYPPPPTSPFTPSN